MRVRRLDSVKTTGKITWQHDKKSPTGKYKGPSSLENTAAPQQLSAKAANNGDNADYSQEPYSYGIF